MYYSNSLTVHGVQNIGYAPMSTVGAQATPTQKASFQFKPGQYYSQFPWMYYYQQMYGQPQFPTLYQNPLTNVSRAAANPYLVQPPVANIQFAKTMR